MSVAVHHRLDGPEGAPAVVLVGSLGTTLEMWDPQAAALSAGYRVVRLDLRGHGRSPTPDGPYTMADLAGDVRALLDRLGLERASVCGLSIGGMIAMQLAADSPERVERLVLCCTSSHLPPAEAWHERAALVRAEGVGVVAPAVLERWFTPGFAAEHPDLVDGFREMLAATPADGYAACSEAIADFDLRDRLAEIQASTLVIAGAEDPATPPEHGRLIAERIPAASIEILSPAAHLANVERAERVSAAIAGHLGEGSA